MIKYNLENTDLNVDEVYGGSRLGHSGDDPLPKLLGVDNQAGFRVLGKRKSIDALKLIVLITSFRNSEWPDHLDRETGIFTYYGDRHKPGDLHNTPRDGNLILRNLFDAAHSGSDRIPPILIFGKAEQYRDVQFLGLAVPGADGMGPDEDLVAVWRMKNGVRFQNYKSIFTIIDVPIVSRSWITDIQKGFSRQSEFAPKNWKKWQESRRLIPLLAKPSKRIRNRSEQVPRDATGEAFIAAVFDYYKHKPTQFEHFAMEVAKMTMPRIHGGEVTRPWKDGGRDATGLYKIGKGPSSIDVEFSLEAKLYSATTGVGVKDTSRLISRLRHRQFGVLVTTSYISAQAYAELIEDNHPVIIISGFDIAETLKEKFATTNELIAWANSLTIG